MRMGSTARGGRPEDEVEGMRGWWSPSLGWTRDVSVQAPQKRLLPQKARAGL